MDINILANFLFAFPFFLHAQNAQEKKLQFSDKATHSVSLQYNIGVYPKTDSCIIAFSPKLESLCLSIRRKGLSFMKNI